MKNCCEV